MENQNTSWVIDQEEKVWNDSSKGKRFGGYVIDVIARLIITVILSFLIPSIFPEDNSSYFEGLPLDYTIAVLYYWLFEAATGQTLGKMILGMKIIKEDGSAPSSINVLGRSFCRLIPFDALSLLFGDRAWHDSIPEIRVVDK